MDAFLRQMMENMDEEQVRQLVGSLDEQQVQKAIEWMVEEMVVPHLEDIRERAQGDRPTEDIRQQFESMDEDEREEMFYDTLDNFIATLALCRQRPKEGFEELKAYLRDPYTQEALLLIFENDQHIDAEYTDQLKGFGASHLYWAGVMVLPEMYTEAEVREVEDRFDLGRDPDETGFSGSSTRD